MIKSRKEESNEDVNEAGKVELQSMGGKKGILTQSDCQIT